MQQTTTRQLYAYWDRVRNGRVAPRRFEIEPAKIATLLPETFIAECEGQLAYRFRLAGTKICEQFGRELRGGDLLSLWDVKDRDAFASLLRNVISDAAIGLVSFHAYSDANRQAKFELVVMPLIHTGAAINRLLGAITAVEPPFWLGSVPLVRQEVIELHLHWPDGAPRAASPQAAPPQRSAGRGETVSIPRKPFRVYQGGAD
jgi:hypothetical protein